MFSIPGPLCGSCKDDKSFGITMDLNYCVLCPSGNISGYFLFIAVCKCTVHLALCVADAHISVKNIDHNVIIFIFSVCSIAQTCFVSCSCIHTFRIYLLLLMHIHTLFNTHTHFVSNCIIFYPFDCRSNRCHMLCSDTVLQHRST